MNPSMDNDKRTIYAMIILTIASFLIGFIFATMLNIGRN